MNLGNLLAGRGERAEIQAGEARTPAASSQRHVEWGGAAAG